MKELVKSLQILIVYFLVLFTTTNCNSIDTFLCGDFSEEELIFYRKLDSIAGQYYNITIDKCQRDELKLDSKTREINDSIAFVLLDTIWKYRYKYKLYFIEIDDINNKTITHLYMVNEKPVFSSSDGN